MAAAGDAILVTNTHENIRKEIVFLTEYIANLGKILKRLFEDGILSKNESEEISILGTTMEKNEKLLDVIVKIYDSAKLVTFLDTLRKTDNKRCADKIDGIDDLSEEENKVWERRRRQKYASTLVEQFDLSTFQKKGIIQKLWNVPPQNPNFIGRKDLLKQMAGYLNTKAIITACHGLGGAGKTQLVLEYVWRERRNYIGVLWFNAESKISLEKDFLRLGKILQLFHDRATKNLNRESKAKIVKHWLENSAQEGWLLVFDNAPQSGGADGIQQYIPSMGGKVLVTSRYASGWTQSFPVDVFTRKESKIFLEDILPGKFSEEEKDSFAKNLGDLPLALAQGATYMKKMGITVPRYLELYETKKTKEMLLKYNTLAELDRTLPYYTATVYTTWDATIEEIGQKSPLAKNWLNCCAYLAPNTKIPDYLLETFAKYSDMNPNQDIYDDARRILTSCSMLRENLEDKGNTSVNHVVQDVMQLQHEQLEMLANIFITARTLNDSFLDSSDEDTEITTLVPNTKKRDLIPHLEACLEHLNLILKQEFDFDEEHQESLVKEIELSVLVLLIHLCEGYANVGEVEKRIYGLEKALAIQEKYFGPEYSDLAFTLTNLGNAYGDRGESGDIDKKSEFFERAEAIPDIFYGPKPDPEKFYGLGYFQVAITPEPQQPILGDPSNNESDDENNPRPRNFCCCV